MLITFLEDLYTPEIIELTKQKLDSMTVTQRQSRLWDLEAKKQPTELELIELKKLLELEVKSMSKQELNQNCCSLRNRREFSIFQEVFLRLMIQKQLKEVSRNAVEAQSDKLLLQQYLGKRLTPFQEIVQQELRSNYLRRLD